MSTGDFPILLYVMPVLWGYSNTMYIAIGISNPEIKYKNTNKKFVEQALGNVKI